jgi:predicted signal transduction protein with EAL and GGDEF domain
VPIAGTLSGIVYGGQEYRRFAGDSSLLHLKRIPACELKIDRGFVRDLVEDSEDAVFVSAIVPAIVALGRTLKLQVVTGGGRPRSSCSRQGWAVMRCRAIC